MSLQRWCCKHHSRCPICGHLVDELDLEEVLAHLEPGHEAPVSVPDLSRTVCVAVDRQGMPRLRKRAASGSALRQLGSKWRDWSSTADNAGAVRRRCVQAVNTFLKLNE